MAVVHLMTGDKVWIEADNCQGIFSTYTSVFIGFKIL